VLDLRAGGAPRVEHGLAAVYLGFSVAFGPAMVRWADVRFAHRWAGGPAPVPKPPGGTPERARLEWREWGRACVAAAISAALLLGAVALVDERADATPLLTWLWRLGLVLAVWLVGWPLVETVRTVHTGRSREPAGQRTVTVAAQRVGEVGPGPTPLPPGQLGGSTAGPQRTCTSTT
jgi:hypothetical protein